MEVVQVPLAAEDGAHSFLNPLALGAEHSYKRMCLQHTENNIFNMFPGYIESLETFKTHLDAFLYNLL